MTPHTKPSGAIAVVAEKPSVARDIARVLGASARGEGYLHGNGYVVTWAIGHLASLAQPHEIRPEWRSWRRELLPMLPEKWPLIVSESTKDQFDVVCKILNSPKIGRVVCATDAGREGELIFRHIYEAAGCGKPFDRLWISSLTPDAIRRGFDTLRPGSDYDPLADAARGRSRADWLVGMNLSRSYTLNCGEDLSVGRVQTPTLAMMVERELAIRAFVPEDYIEVVATFRPTGHPESQSYKGTFDKRLAPDGEEAKQVIKRAKEGQAQIASLKAEAQRTPPPLLYDLTDLQRHANRLYSYSAQKTLDTAQALYEKHKLISYPRTDSRYLSKDVAGTLARVTRVIAESYKQHLAPGTGERPLSKRFVDDAKVRDHHAIIPTAVQAGELSTEERKIYDLICRRLLSAWHDDYIVNLTTVITTIGDDRYTSQGTALQQTGWKALDVVTKREEAPVLPSNLAQGQQQDVLDVDALKKKTRAPKRFTEATLLTAMETAGKTLDEKELSDAMKDSGLGTPATRAQIIEVLLKRGYVERDAKTLQATDKGIRLVEIVHPEVKSPAMTGQWEAYLKRIERGEAKLEPFLKGIENYVSEIVGQADQRSSHTPMPEARHEPNTADLSVLLKTYFHHESFRANQQQVCQTVVEGKDALLVMPTGAGKSLCYQLPAIARGGTTLVISPLIALMEDQFQKLRQLGFSVECIHSGRDRGSSRQVCQQYLQGNLQFLFIAPERLRVPGFPEMLARRKPSLIAIDEAHCISQWGHDFRPDYRLLGSYLPQLRPAPVIALTATATEQVQRDICNQLGLAEPTSYIHGFRRDNIAIEVVETNTNQRAELARRLLKDENHRPAIVYTPSRKQAESVAELLSESFSAAAYHAGLDAGRRQKVQRDFLEGKTEVIVATIAFGMGIDKPDVRSVIHTALPGSIEAYYQEIGRAGRDGQPSRAILMHSYADRYTHDFFFERDYPEPAILDQLFRKLSSTPIDTQTLRKQTRVPVDTFDKALEKLWTHGGAIVDASENVTRGHDQWRDAYSIQGEQKRAQIDQTIRYAQSNHCRMATLIRHFGDIEDGLRPCGICDFCAPDECVAQRFREATADELKLAAAIMTDLKFNSKSAGKLHTDLCGKSGISRDEFEELLGAMARANLLRLTDHTFEKDGKEIPYRKAALARDAELHELTIRETKSPGPAPKKGAARSKKRQAKEESDADPKVEAALREWRSAIAKRQGVPAFVVMHDRVLRAIATELPRTPADLLAIPGIGIKAVEKYGAQIYRILNEGVK